MTRFNHSGAKKRDLSHDGLGRTAGDRQRPVDSRERAFYEDMGYEHIARLESGELCAGIPMLYTFALVVGIEPVGYRTRFCYESRADVIAALDHWNGIGDPPGPWIKQKPENRENPDRS